MTMKEVVIMNAKQVRQIAHDINFMESFYYSQYFVTEHYCRPYKEVRLCIKDSNNSGEIINYLVCNDETKKSIIDWALNELDYLKRCAK